MQEEKQGSIYMALAFIMWGTFPLYWKMVEHVQSEEILAHRIIWSFCFMIILIFVQKQIFPLLKQLLEMVKQPKLFLNFILSSVLISLNWFVFIWAVNHERVLETSLGYYINPIVSVFLGRIFFNEKMNKGQQLAFVLAGIGVFVSAVEYGQIPWVSLILALTFGFYGLTKKVIKLKASFSLTLETLLVLPIGILYVLYLQLHDQSAFFIGDTKTTLLLMGGGIATAIPLLLFAMGASKIPLFMVGILQFITPTMTFFIGVFLYHEPFTLVDLITFSFIWCGIIIFTFSQQTLMNKLKIKNRKTIEM
ncbi:EamA family transporter RarD [Bacillus sp. FJAT-47783]|uniref:EamA family transporter RarD n=1 Tax=Bacillus sp. FJAT-47783 TaxID=2922712 RepID=UPI001FADCB80|nr:EamA family transporter RarD [Bacillus sp. FJAT-47783]